MRRRSASGSGRERLVEITGNPALTGFQAPKVLWLRDEEPANFDRVAHVLLPKDYVRLPAAGELATDASDAAGTLFMDLRRPHVVVGGARRPRGARGLAPSRPREPGADPVSSRATSRPSWDCRAGSRSRPAAGTTPRRRSGRPSPPRGSCRARSGRAASCSPTPMIGAVDPSGRIHAFAHAVPGRYCLLAVTLSAGGSLRWWRDTTGSGYEELVAEAEAVPPGSEGLVFLPYLTGERTPHLDPSASGAFVGLTARHTRAHMTRAVMEGVLFSLRDGLEIMRGPRRPSHADPRDRRRRRVAALAPAAGRRVRRADAPPRDRGGSGLRRGAARSRRGRHVRRRRRGGGRRPDAARRSPSPTRRARPRTRRPTPCTATLYGTLREDMHRLASLAAT